ncbi:putative membrane protein 89 [Achromobacter xylosoxidans A8]|uniref:Putative membrane protein 89 n=1 Tax=Achromobacter xylosoxidans (strain A8) TaxID=762376 RepID=E3HQH3_ACHXA|nr:hypothetical protein [Achromobacter xylosoxidans]ADP19607.1 putative membrane protein 89 [Achromobacter xylosoxidans A8]
MIAAMEAQRSWKSVLTLGVAFFGASTAAIALYWFWTLSGRGVELSDEAFYLLWMRDPWQYHASATQFGFIYHPLYVLLSGDVTMLRWFTYLVTFALAALLGGLVMWRSSPFKGGWSLSGTLCVALMLGSMALLTVGPWIPTPNYNILNSQGLTMGVIGYVLADRTASRTSTLGWFCLVIGCWLIFMAKPTSAVAFAILAFTCLCVTRQVNWRLLGLACLLGGALLTASALLEDGSIYRFADRLKNGAAMYQILGAQHDYVSMFRADIIAMSEYEWHLCLILALATILVLLVQPLRAFGLVGSLTLVVVASVLAMMAMAGYSLINGSLTIFRNVVFLAVPAGAAVAVVVRALVGYAPWPSFRQVVLAALLLLVPHLSAFGTAANYWPAAGSNAMFWGLSAVALVVPGRREEGAWIATLPISAFLQFGAVCLLGLTVLAPYRQSVPLVDQHARLLLTPGTRPLQVAEPVERYISNLRDLARGSGFVAGTPVIDLTGRSPGTVYALGGNAIGQPWMVGGYPGSQDLARVMLDTVPCKQMAEAWLLAEPEGVRPMPLGLLPELGIDLSRDYALIGTVMSPKGEVAASYSQFLYKPTRELKAAVAACDAARESRGSVRRP